MTDQPTRKPRAKVSKAKIEASAADAAPLPVITSRTKRARAAAAKAVSVPKPVVAAPVAPAVLAAKAVALEAVSAAELVAESASPAAEPATLADLLTGAAMPQKDNVMATTESTTQDAAAKGEAFLTEAQTRAKAAMEKSSALFTEMSDFSKGNVEALVESSKIAAKAVETMGQDVAEYGRKSLEHATAAMKSLATAKSPTEFFKLQSDFVRGSFDAFVAETSKSTETALKLAGEVAQPLSSRVSLAVEKVRVAA